MANPIPTPAMLRHRKTQKKGIKFTIMLCGSGGCGKSSFINTLCQQQVLSPAEMLANIPSSYNAEKDPGLDIVSLNVELPDEGNGILSIKFIDTPGFGDNLDNSASFTEIVNYICKQYDDVLAEESRIRRNPRFVDNRVHALVYFITATGHGLREQDVEFMKLMSTKVNVIPVIAKSDSLTVEELELNKDLIIQDLKHYNIPIYGFPGVDNLKGQSFFTNEEENDYDANDTDSIIDDEFIELNKYIRAKVPFAVIGASEIIETADKQIQARRYPWGVLDVNNPEYSDMELLRDILTRTHLSDLKETTHFILYENYRTEKLSRDLPSASPSPMIKQQSTMEGASNGLGVASPRPPYTSQILGGSTTTVNTSDVTGEEVSSEHNNSILLREEQLRANEEKLRQIENKVQNEILQKRQELLNRERELKELELKLKTETENLRERDRSIPAM